MSYLALKDEPPKQPVIVNAEPPKPKVHWLKRTFPILHFNFKHLGEAILLGLLGRLR